MLSIILHRKHLIILVIVVLILQSFSSFSQVSFSNSDRAVYLMDIVKYIKWENEESFFQFKIVLIDKDSTFFYELDSLSKVRKKVHGKPVVVQLIENIDDMADCQALYTNKNKGFNITEIIGKLQGKNTLLITENFEFHRTMINFVVVDNEKRFEVNEHMLEEHNLKAPSLFMALAVNNRRDWESMFFETDSMLLREKEIVKEQNERIKRQNADIEKQIERIISQKNKILLQESKIESQQNALKELTTEIIEKQEVLGSQQNEIREKESALENYRIEIEDQNRLRNRLQKDIDKKRSLFLEHNEKMIEVLHKVDKQRMYILYFLALILLLVAFAVFIYRSYKIKQKINKELEEKNEAILERNEEITQQKEEILAQRDEIEIQRDKILKQNVEITDSILYARRIQTAILPRKETLNRILPDHFIFYLPRDIVSGDFYWVAKKDNKTVVVVSDCTGHGVPGAFMSMLGVSLLNEIIGKSDLNDASKILEDLRHMIKITLSQTGKKDEAKDGMDMVLCIIDDEKNQLLYAGANNPIYIIRNK